MLLETLIGFGAALVVFLYIEGVNIAPVLLVAGILFLLYYFVERRGELIPSRVTGGTPSNLVSFDDIGGQGPAKRELKEALDFMLEAESVRDMGIRPLKGILLTGPPGTGKTLLAKAAADYVDASFLAANGSEFIEMYAGIGAQRVRGIFRRARQMGLKAKKNRAVIFLDEVDVLGGKRGTYQSHQEYDQTLNQLLVEMDGLRYEHDKSRVHVLVVAASNRADLLDPALLRPGRFDRIVQVDLPDKRGRKEILELHTRNKPLGTSVELDLVAQETFGFSGAHLESVANEAAILALRDKTRLIEMHHFREAIDKVMLGERLERKPTPEELYRVAVHETGHALISELIHPGTVTHLTITSRANALGYMRQTPMDDVYLFTKEYLEGRIMICLGGSVAEDLILGSGSTGAAGDFREAVRLSKEYMEAGLSELGVVSTEDLPADIRHRTIQEIISGQQSRTRELLSSYRDVLVQLAEFLVREDTLDGDYLRTVLAGKSNCA